MGVTDERVRQFEEAHGRAPSPVETRRIHRAAWRETRQAKNHAVAPRRQLATWAAAGNTPTLTSGRPRRVLGFSAATR